MKRWGLLFVVALLFGCSDGTIVGGPSLLEDSSLADVEAPGAMILGSYNNTDELDRLGIALGDTLDVIGLFPEPRMFVGYTPTWYDDYDGYSLEACQVVLEQKYDLGELGSIQREELGSDTLGQAIWYFLDVPVAGEIEPDYHGITALCSLVVVDPPENERDPVTATPTWHMKRFETPAGVLNVIPNTTKYENFPYGRLGGPGAADVYAELNGKRSRLVVGEPLEEYNYHEIIWVGDLDDDGIPDLIMDFGASGGYHVFLSSLAVGDELYGHAAVGRYRGC